MSNSDNLACWKRCVYMLVSLLIAGLTLSGCHTGNNQHMVMAENQETDTVNEAIKISRELDKPEYAGLASAIHFHSGDYPIRTTVSHKRFSDGLIKKYMDNLDRVGVLAHDRTVNPVMVYEELGFELEKAWCNNDVRNFINDARMADKKSSDAKEQYGAFEELARYCLAKDNKTCSDMDKEQLLQQR